MTVYAFPSTREITHVVRNRAVDPTRFIGRSFCPIRPVYAGEVEFDVLEAGQGMTAAHNLGADPKLVNIAGMKTKKIGTGYWKETKRIDEKELLHARMAGTYNERAGRQLVVEKAVQLDDRLETRVEWLTWQPLVANQIVIDENGVKYTVVYDIPEDNKPEITDNAKKWSNPDSDIMGDITSYLLLYRGTGGKATKACFNLQVAGYMAKNKGIKAALAGTQYAKFLSAVNIADALKLLFPKVDFIIYDEGYTEIVNKEAVFTPFIPDDRFIMLGEGQPGEDLMDFGSTISLHNGGLDKPQPGKFSVVEDKSAQEKNPYIDITVGIYGLPRLYHPNWVVTAKIN